MKKAVVISLGSVFICLIGILVLWFFSPKQIPRMPDDNELINDHFNQTLPGYSQITVLDRRGKGNGGDPRVLTLRISMETDANPISCEGRLRFFISDPAFFNFTWNSLICSGQDHLIRLAQQAFTKDYRYIFPCHREKIASVLVNWVRNKKVPVGKINDPSLRSLVNTYLEEKKETPNQVILIDLSRIRTIDLDPSIATEQKVRQYVLKCDGAVDEYLAKENITIVNRIILDNGDVLLDPPPASQN
jgi:hypothetical protein